MPGLGEVQNASILNLGGGQNDGDPATHIGDNEVASCLNFYPIGPRLRRRPGTERLTSTAWSEALTSLFSYKTADAVWTLIIGSETRLNRLDGSGIVALSITDSGAYSARSEPWVMTQYQDVGYATRRGTGSLKRFKSDFMQDAGIAAPTVAPVLADGGAGTLTPAAEYFGVYTFYNTETGAESDYSPVSSVLSLPDTEAIDWSAIGTSLNGQVNARRLYRTLPDQQGAYFFVAQINDNVTTTYTGDEFGQGDLGDPVSTKNGLPPENLAFHALFKERIFATDERDLFHSEAGKPESWDPEAILSVYKDDGHKIRGLAAFGERLMIGKTNGVHFLVGNDPSDFAIQTLTRKHGCYSHHSMKDAEGLFYWYGGDHVLVTDGVSVETISDPKVNAVLSAIPTDQKENVVGAIYSPLNWYVLACASGVGQTTPNHLLVYNYKTKAWCVFKYFANTKAPSFVGDFYDTDSSPLLYCLFDDDYVYDQISGNYDVATLIKASFRTKAHGFNADYLLRGMRRISVLTSGTTGYLTARLYRNLTNVAHKTRTLIDMALSANPWKGINLSNMDQLATSVQVEVEYEDIAPIDISGIEFELVTFNRKGKPQ